MGRSGTKPAIVAIAIATLLILSMMPTAQAAKLITTGLPIPCAAVAPGPPPDVAVGDCAAPPPSDSTSSHAPYEVNATPVEDADINVTWTADTSTITGFTIYRGATPWTLSPIATTDSTDRSFTDTQALASGQAIWYAVASITDTGKRVMSQPTLIDPS